MNSEHAWVLERIEARLAGGLEEADVERLETHLKSCDACRKQADEAAAADETLRDLFAGVGPEPGLEDRVIRAVMGKPRGGWGRILRFWTAVAAAVALLGAVGFVFKSTGGRPVGKAPADRGFFGGGTVSGEGMSDQEVKFTLEEPQVQGLASPDVMLRTVTASLSNKFGGRYGGESVGSEIQGGRDTTVNQRSITRGPEPEAPRAEPAPKPATPPPPAETRLVGTPPAWDDGAIGGMGGQAGGQKQQGKLGWANEGEKFGDRWNAPASKTEEAQREYNNQDLDKVRDALNKNDAKEAGAAKRPVSPGAAKEAEGKYASKVQDPVEPPDPKPAQRKIVRHGTMEFEVDSFDSAVERLAAVVGKEGGFIATVNSDRLPNGKVRGTVAVRIPPEALDRLVLMLRTLGDLKSQQIAAQDVTKHYTDLESRLRAGRTMEERLIKIIQEGKGEVKALLEVEKELGNWRVKIEEMEGEIRYYNNLISMSTLTLQLVERDIRTPHSATLAENVDMGVEAVDVDKAYKAALAHVENAEIKGKVLQSDLKVLEGGRMNALVVCMAPPDKAGRLRDLFSQLGKLARLDVTQQQKVEGGVGLFEGLQVKRVETTIRLSLFNLTGAQPRRIALLSLVCDDVPKAYADLRGLAEAKGRVIESSLNRQKSEQTAGTLRCEMPADLAADLLGLAQRSGEALRMEMTENPSSQNVTESKQGFSISLLAPGSVAARETNTLTLASKDVPNAYRTLQAKILDWGGRILDGRLTETDRENIMGLVDFDVPRAKFPDLNAQLGALGDIFSRNSARSTDTQNTTDSKIRVRVDVIPASQIPPKETTTLAIVVSDVEEAFKLFKKSGIERKARIVTQTVGREPDGDILARLVMDVPLAQFETLVDAFKKAGEIRVERSSPNPHVSEGELAVGRIDVTLGNASKIIPSDEGVGDKLRLGLSTGFVALMWSLNLILIGAAVVVPWGLVVLGGIALYRRMRKPRSAA